MNSDAASFIGNIPEHYDSGLGPMIFVDYAADIARRKTEADQQGRNLQRSHAQFGRTGCAGVSPKH
jgi:hypothetical protein